MIEAKTKAVRAAASALEKKAVDAVILEMKELVAFADYFVICSGGSTTQVKAIVRRIEEALLADGIRPMGVEGLQHGRWVLMDYNDVIVHVFDEETRQYYELEKLWLDAPRVPLEAAGRRGQAHMGGKDKRPVRPSRH